MAVSFYGWVTGSAPASHAKMLSVPAYLFTILFSLACPALHAQAGGDTRCVIHGDVTLAMVMHWIGTLSESRTITLIDVCRIGFPLDAAAIDRLDASNASPAVIDALNKATAAELSVDQAQSQVSELQHHIDVIDASVNKDRDAALAVLDVSYQTQVAKAGTCKSKDEFETTAQYTARCRQLQSSLAVLQSQNIAARNTLIASYSDQAAKKEAPFLKRIHYLESAGYPDLRPAVYKDYSTVNGQLHVTLGDQDYIFGSVAADTADSLIKNWQSVRITRPFTEDAQFSRNLVFASLSFSGYSTTAHAAQIMQQGKADAAKAVAAAQQLMAHKQYEAAQAMYQHALKLDSANLDAKAGLAAAENAVNQRNAEIAHGVWSDPKNNLMWTVYDNRSAINWKAADHYCRTLRTDNHFDWRMPTIEELGTLYNPDSTRQTLPLSATESDVVHLQIVNHPTGSTWPVHINEAIQLSAPHVWSATKDPSADSAERESFYFVDGQVTSSPTWETETLRTLCVRNPVAATTNTSK